VIKLYLKDNCKNLQDYERVEIYKGFPIYKHGHFFKCSTDIFNATEENIVNIKSKIDELLCDKRLLLPFGLYTNEASKLEMEVHKVFDPIITQWVDKGYNINDIEIIATKVVDVRCIEERMKRLSKLKVL